MPRDPGPVKAIDALDLVAPEVLRGERGGAECEHCHQEERESERVRSRGAHGFSVYPAPRRRVSPSLAPSPVPRPAPYVTVPIGSLRMRFPVNAKIALQTAGAIGGVPGSPTPPGASLLGTMCTSTTGISAIWSMR